MTVAGRRGVSFLVTVFNYEMNNLLIERPCLPSAISRLNGCASRAFENSPANNEQLGMDVGAVVEYWAVALSLVRYSTHANLRFELTMCGMFAKNSLLLDRRCGRTVALTCISDAQTKILTDSPDHTQPTVLSCVVSARHQSPVPFPPFCH